MKLKSCRAVLLGAGLLFVDACSKPAPGPPASLAVVRFENLSGDPSLEWLGRGSSEVLATSLSGAVPGTVISTMALSRIEIASGNRPPGTPGISSQRSAAFLAGAKILVSGYFERTPAGIRFRAIEEDSSTGKTLRTFSVTGPPTIETLLSLSHEFSPTAHPYLTSNTDALRLYVSAAEGPDAEAEASLRKSVAADRNFGPAWVSLAAMVSARGDRSEAARVVDEALAGKVDKLSAASLRLDKATAAGDEAGRAGALAEIIEASPGDTSLLRQLAQLRSTAGQFADAAALWQKLVSALPDDADGWNQLGYTRAWSGDYPGALAAMRQYSRVRPTDPNSDDSTGDIHLMYRHYPEAAASYLASVAKVAFFQNGTSIYKAAWAKFLAGDTPGADKIFAKYREAHEKQGTPTLSLVEGDWLYRTGREKEAAALLRKEVLKATSVVSQAVYYQVLTVWDLLAKDREAAVRDAKEAGPAKSALAAIVQFVALPSASAAEWSARAEKMLPGPQLANLRQLALGYALVLDGKKAEALPVWERIVAGTPAGDFAIRAVYLRLKGEKPALEVVPSPGTVNAFGSLADKIQASSPLQIPAQPG